MSYRGKEYLGVREGTTAKVLANKPLNGKAPGASGYQGVVWGRGFEPEGREFESLRARIEINSLVVGRLGGRTAGPDDGGRDSGLADFSQARF